MTEEELRLAQDALREKNWKRWGPFLSERQWGTVREDYSANGDSWNYFPHDHARSRAYRWGEDGLLGFCDRQCRLCFCVALWNTRDPILKERLFGLTGPEGNHGEDVKELYYYLDSTPTHSYCRALYKYPQQEFPYSKVVEENRRRGKQDLEFEISDAGAFDERRYFDVFVEYAKGAPNDVLVQITAVNRGPDRAVLHLLPTLWFRNTWAWGCTHEGCEVKPSLEALEDGSTRARHVSLGEYRFWTSPTQGGASPALLFTENETNSERLFGQPNVGLFVKDGVNACVVEGVVDAVNPLRSGTKAAAHYIVELAPGEEFVVRARLSEIHEAAAEPLGPGFDDVFAARRREADAFYAIKLSPGLTQEQRRVQREAYAGLLWSKQFYHFVVDEWLAGDPSQPPAPPERQRGRNHDWPHMFCRDVLSMPDKWEYPWFAAWDAAFHMIPASKVDPQFAKDQLSLLLREWYMHPNGQIPAYEYNFSDVNPPVHAWACWRIYKMTGPRGGRDRLFLRRVFKKLLLNFTWWVNRKDVAGKHLFAGGFLGLDNIGVFDRSMTLPAGVQLEQADGTAWMAFYCGTMLSMALELAQDDPAYEDIASKFFVHFIAIADAMNTMSGVGLWCDQDGFYYDQMHANGKSASFRIRSMVGLIPLVAVEVLEEMNVDGLPGFKRRARWFMDNRKDLAKQISYMERPGKDGASLAVLLLAIPSRERLERMLRYMLDENEFLSPFGIRSLSKVHKQNPYIFSAQGQEFRVAYTPGESDSYLFGGNSNWRGPIWFPVNFLILESLEKYYHFYGDSLRVECPTGSGRWMNLREVVVEIARRLSTLFLPDASGRRPFQGGDEAVCRDPHAKDLLLFHEYFHGETGRGMGASHQTGWTALIARVLDKWGRTATESRGTDGRLAKTGVGS